MTDTNRAFADYLELLGNDWRRDDCTATADDYHKSAAVIRELCADLDRVRDQRDKARASRERANGQADRIHAMHTATAQQRDDYRASLYCERNRAARVLRRVVRQRDKLQARIDRIASALMHDAFDDGK